ncbi:SatD family protein [Isoptericola sp. NEAU-Y5]|uniref:SatD family protein n=1 Tax=Isoptericola luteus TaxID=2879484 RepID=A0ABS7ZI34_9MICO|nr:SatD family protein [Isoptericola sp. NEAU-Y5]MCA5894683.1 SatD family protein [Isoptericola sp. NEAU-Y5]
MIVITADQRGSTGNADRVPEVLDALARRTAGHAGVVLGFERTVGDEVQGVLDADEGAALAVDLVLDLVRDGGWSVGVGLGAVDEPLPEVSRAASGAAFVRARRAVERAKGRGSAVPVAVAGSPREPYATVASDAEALLRLLGAVVARRTEPGWEAVDTLAGHAGEPGPQRATAASLGVSEQAVSQRLRAALWAEDAAVRPLAARLLRAGAGERPDDKTDDETDDETDEGVQG